MPPGGSKPGFEEVPAIPEQRNEVPETGASFESPTPAVEQPSEPVPAAPVASPAPAPIAAPKDPSVRAVEAILEEDLGDAFRKMTPEMQAKFRKEGERITAVIVEMVRNAKVNARLVLNMLARWLKMIPGVNRFFLTQEAKIKTDKILKL
ncbi:MAG: hypothetical protein QY323_01855 [Patescibacteria group bacterium]|nr:MAG: hypothetical protein QY323_01855 [Patescibacteria group bacterium]